MTGGRKIKMSEQVNVQEGVKEEATSPEQEESPPPNGELKTSEKADGDEEVLPFGKHPRWQKMTKQNHELKSRVKNLEGVLDSNKEAINFHKWATSDPKIAKVITQVVYDLFEGRDPFANGKETPKEDPYAQYDDLVAEKLREIDSLKQKLADREEREARDKESWEKRSRSQIQNEIDDEFQNLLIADGFMTKDGKFDKHEMSLIESAMKGMIRDHCEDPERPTKAEVRAIYKHIKEKSLPALQKRSFKKAVLADVPASGSGRGPLSNPNKVRSEAERLRDIESML